MRKFIITKSKGIWYRIAKKYSCNNTVKTVVFWYTKKLSFPIYWNEMIMFAVVNFMSHWLLPSSVYVIVWLCTVNPTPLPHDDRGHRCESYLWIIDVVPSRNLCHCQSLPDSPVKGLWSAPILKKALTYRPIPKLVILSQCDWSRSICFDQSRNILISFKCTSIILIARTM